MSDAHPECSLTNTRTAKDRLWLLFWVSAVTLFLELALIRWVSTEVRIFAYLQSSVLVVCLLGLGMGCFASHRAIDLRRLFIPLTLVAGLLSFPPAYEALSRISSVLAEFGNFMIWGALADQTDTSVLNYSVVFLLALFLTALMLFLVWVAFIPLGQMVGAPDRRSRQHRHRLFGQHLRLVCRHRPVHGVQRHWRSALGLVCPVGGGVSCHGPACR